MRTAAATAMTAGRGRTLWVPGVVLTLAWGAGAFGGNYPWAYTPLLIAAATLGVAGSIDGVRERTLPVDIAIGLGSIAAVAGIQMIPLPRALATTLSPNLDSVLRQYNVAHALLAPDRFPLSIAPDRTVLGLAFLLALGALLIGTAAVLSRQHARQLAVGIAVLGSVMAAVGVVQKAMGTLKVYGFWVPMAANDPFGPFINRNHFAGWMLMALPLSIGLLFATLSRSHPPARGRPREWVQWLSSPHANQSILLGFSILIMALSLLLTTSRSGMVSMSVGLVFLGGLVVFQQRPSSQKALAAGFLLLLVLAAGSWAGFETIAARFADTTPTDAGFRIAIWKDTLRIARDFWLTGTGLNTFGTATLFYQTALPEFHLREAHSDVLQLASEGGALLCVPILMAIGLVVRLIVRRFRADEGSAWWLRAGAAAGLVAIGVQSLVEFSLQMPGNAALFATVAGLALHEGRRPAEPAGVTAAHRPLSREGASALAVES